MPHNTGEGVIAAEQLQIGIADPRLQHAHPRLAGVRLRQRQIRPEARLLIVQPNALHGGGYCFSYGLPSAAGATARPTTPVSTRMVSKYGSICGICDGICG